MHGSSSSVSFPKATDEDVHTDSSMRSCYTNLRRNVTVVLKDHFQGDFEKVMPKVKFSFFFYLN